MIYACNAIERIIRDHTGTYTSTEKLVAITLVSYADRHCMEARPSIERLVKDTLLSRRCIFKTLKSLKEKGKITPTNRQITREKFSTVYKINVSNSPTRAPGAPNPIKTSAPDAPNTPILPQNMDFTRAPGAPHPLYIDNILYNSKKPSEENSPGDEMQEKFKEWWDAYPRKLNRAKAYLAFCQAMKETDFETLMRKAKSFARMRKRITDRQPEQEIFTKAAHTWLGLEQRGWEDDYGIDEVKHYSTVEIKEDITEPHEIQIIRNKIKESFGNSVYKSWFMGQKMDIKGKVLSIKADSRFMSDWITQKYHFDLLKIAGTHFDSIVVAVKEKAYERSAA